MRSTEPAHSVWLAAALAAIAGFADVLGYLILSQIFTSHMTGNAARAGLYIGAGHWAKFMLRGMAIPAYVAGVALGFTTERVAVQSGSRIRLAPAFAFELALLVAFIFVCRSASIVRPDTSRFYALLWILSVAMGLQSATLRRASGRTVQTTFMTGMLLNLGQESVEGAFDAAQGRRRPARRHWSNACVFGGVFLAFALGAALGSLAETRFHCLALVLPAAALGAIIVGELARSRTTDG
ncbi:MAG: YoaK family protein [Opitutaceae bacterium]